MSRLLVLAPSLGLVTETFITRHCKEIAPGQTSFATFDIHRPDEAWPLDRVAILPPSDPPAPTTIAKITSRLQPRQRRRARRDVWHLSPGALTDLEHAISRFRPESALIEYLDRWLDAIPLLVDAGIRVVVHGHGYDISACLLNKPTAQAYRDILPLANSVVVPSEHAGRRLAENGVGNVKVIPYGIEPAKRVAQGSDRTTNVRVIAVGRLVEKKDPVGLVRAIAGARTRGAGVRLDVFGDGPLRPDVEKEIDRLGLVDHVHLHGATANDRIRDAMADSDLFAQRSVRALGGDEEGLPLAILEAMAARLPIVSTHHAGIPEAVRDGETGILLRESDTDGFAEALAAYTSDPERRTRDGRAGERRVQRYFEWTLNRRRLMSELALDDGNAGA